MIHNKKGFELSFNVIIVAAILLVTLVIVLVFVSGGFKKLFGGVDNKIDNLGDPDKDGVTNLFDKCPCEAAGAKPSKEFEGCPEGTTAEYVKNPNKACSG